MKWWEPVIYGALALQWAVSLVACAYFLFPRFERWAEKQYARWSRR